MTTDTFPLPSTYAYGKVVGRIIYAVSVDRQGRRDCRVDRNTVRVAGCILGMGGCLRSLGRHDGRG